MNTSSALIGLHSLSIRLFPARFQGEYGPEMRSVFYSACLEASASPLSLARLAIREARDLPFNLLREHLSEFKRAVMKAPETSSRSSSHFSLRGALVFAAAFLVAYLIPAVIDAALNSNVLMMGSGSILNGRWTYLQALACGLGVFLLSRPSHPLRALAAGLAAALGISLFFRAGMFVPLFRSPASIQVTALRVTATFLPEIIKGAIAGLALAWAGGNMKTWGLHTAAGSLGFSFSWLTVALLGSTVVAQIQSLGGSNEILIGSIWYFIYEVGLMVPYGLVLGAVLGTAASLRQPSPRVAASL